MRKWKMIIVTHADSDGVICVAICLLAGKKPKRVYFTSVYKLKRAICKAVAENELSDELIVTDLSPTEKLLRIASAFDRVTWIDHHRILEPIPSVPENVRLVLDENSPSAASIVARYFNVQTKLAELADEIDRNAVKSEDARFLRDLIGAIKLKFRGSEQAKKLRSIAKILASGKLEELQAKESVIKMVGEYRKLVESVKARALEKVNVIEANGKKIAIYEARGFVPIYAICEKLKEHAEAPFDVITIVMRYLDKNKRNIITKLEFRTHTNEDVHRLATGFGGGGHARASGASFNGFLTKEQIAKRISELLTK